MGSVSDSKCRTCKGTISEFHQGIKCIKCQNSYHSRCVGLSGKNRQELQKISTIWHCCQTSASPKPSNQTNSDSRSSTPTTSSTLAQAQLPLTQSVEKNATTTDGFQRLEHLMIEIKQSLLDQLLELRHQIANLVEENIELKEQLKHTQEGNTVLRENLSKLESEVEYLQEKENVKNIVISGIPDRSINPLTLTADILKTINSNVSLEQIDSAQYIGKFEPQSENRTPRNSQNFILVKLTSTKAKQEILAKKKAFKNLFSDQVGFGGEQVKQIFLRDHLTAKQLQLFRAVRQFKIANEFQFLWTTDNRILLRKTQQTRAIHIKNITDLEKLHK